MVKSVEKGVIDLINFKIINGLTKIKKKRLQTFIKNEHQFTKKKILKLSKNGCFEECNSCVSVGFLMCWVF